MTSAEDRSSYAGADPYALALRSGHEPVYLRSGDGHPVRMPVHRWYAQPAVADESVLHRCVGPVLDVGCGRGRLCREAGINALVGHLESPGHRRLLTSSQLGRVRLKADGL
ncbi:hypothetical protein [Streptomyces sp. NPDC001275]